MFIHPFNKTELQGIMNETPLSKEIPFSGMVGFVVHNITPAFLELTNSEGATLAVVPPWSITQGNVSEFTTMATIAVDYSLPMLGASNIPLSKLDVIMSYSSASVPELNTTMSVGTSVPQSASSTMSLSGPSGFFAIIGGTIDLNALQEQMSYVLQGLTDNSSYTLSNPYNPAGIADTISYSTTLTDSAVSVTAAGSGKVIN